MARNPTVSLPRGERVDGSPSSEILASTWTYCHLVPAELEEYDRLYYSAVLHQ